MFNNVHQKKLCRIESYARVQYNLFTFDRQYFHNEKTFVRTTEVKKQCVLIKQIVKISLYFLFGTVFPYALRSVNQN